MNAILLAGAALVGLPVLLHLIMKQEPKRLSFPAFRFLTQKLKTNQRKLRLRHFLLLALRMLLIALFCLTLYQPTLKSDRLNIRGEQPVATAVVIDTSPSMGYTQNDKTRLAEAVRRARELLDELPEKSPVAVVTTDDPAAAQWVDIPEARTLLDKLDKPRGGNHSVTEALAQVYGKFGKIEAVDVEEPEKLPKLVAVFTDRAAASWEKARVEGLKRQLNAAPPDGVADPKPAHVVVDVGVDQPVNVGLLAAEMAPQVIAANQTATVLVTVAASGPAELAPVEAVVLAKLAGSSTLRRPVVVAYGRSQAVTFEFANLKPGTHQVEFSLDAPDKLMSDNSRFLTFKVGEARRILTIADDPAAAAFWQLGHQSKGEFACLVVRPEEVRTAEGGRTEVRYPNPAKPEEVLTDDLRAFEAVCLFEVRNPNEPAGNTLWDKLRPYVERGGKLAIVPGNETLSVEGYAAGGGLMPGAFVKVIETAKADPAPPKQSAPGWPDPRDGKNGVTWFLDDKVIENAMLRPFQGWQAKGNVDAVKNPRVARKYWEVRKAPGASAVVSYNDAASPADRRPAVLERGVADPKEPLKVKGRVLLLTTRLHVPTADDAEWNNYWESEGSSWYVVFPWLVARHLAGDTADANFNHAVGHKVTVPVPKGNLPRGTKVVVDGPDIGSDDALVEIGDRQTEFVIGPPRTNQPGNFKMEVAAVRWTDGFSLNAPAEESTLDKVPAEGIEELTGPGTVFPLDRDVKLRDVIPVILDQPIDLFPWLLILVLVLLAAEGVVANRFYRRVK